MPIDLIVRTIGQAISTVSQVTTAINQTRIMHSQSKAIELAQKRDSDNQQLGLKRMEFDAQMEMVRQAARSKERQEDREFSLALKQMEAERFIESERMRQVFQSMEADKQRQFTQAIEKFKAELQVALQADNLAFQRWKTETDREFALALRFLDAQIARQRDKQRIRDDKSPVFSVADDILKVVLNRKQMPLTIFFSPPVLRYDPVPSSSPQSQFPMMEATLSAALRHLSDQYSGTQRPIKFMGGEWITKTRRAESALNQIYADLAEIPVIVLETEVEESYLNINLGFWNNDFDDARFRTVVRRFRWQEVIGEINQRLLQQWQATDKTTTINTPNGTQTHPDLIRHSREAFTHYMEVLHCVHVGMVIDEYFLLYAPQRQLPLLPTLLPELLEEANLPPEECTALVHTVIDYSNALFDGLAEIEPASIVELRLAWAKILQNLDDRYTFAAQVQAAMAAWLQQRNYPSSDPLTDISTLIIPEDQAFVDLLNPCLSALDLPMLNIALSCFQRGLRHLEAKEYQLARLDFDRTIATNPHADAYFQRGLACLKLEDYSSAIKDFDQAAMLQPQRAETHEYRGDAYQGLKNYEAALANYNQGIHIGSITAIPKRDKLQAWSTDERRRQQEAEAARLKAEAEQKRLAEAAEAARQQAEAERRKQLSFELPNDGGILEFVWIPAVKLVMDNGHEVDIPEFRMSKYPITQGQYKALMKKNPSNFTSDYSGHEGKQCLAADRPVEKVDWRDAKAFCEALTKESVMKDLKVQLPSETQWEYACRGVIDGSKTKFWFGNNDGDLPAHAWFSGNARGMTHSVKERESENTNPFGLVDMHGNVWEWCADNYTSNISQLPKYSNPYQDSGDSGDHAVRGGAWDSHADLCSSAYRLSWHVDGRVGNIGFRVALFSVV